MKILKGNIVDQYPGKVLPLEIIPSNAWRNGLVVRMPNWLGDSVMALPALWQLKKMLPQECALFVVAPEFMQGFYSSLDFVDGILPLKKLHSNWSLREIKSLRRFRMGVGLFFNNSFREIFMMRLCGIKRLYGTDYRNRKFFLTGAFDMKKIDADGNVASVHLINRFLSMVYALGATKWDGSLVPFNIKTRPEELREELRSFCNAPNLLVLGCGGARGPAKRWQPEKFAIVARHHIERGGTVVATGSKEEWEIAQKIVENLPSDRAFNLAGKTNLEELMLILQNARAVVSNDSGAMHLAAALGTPGVAIFGPTEHKCFTPMGNHWTIMASTVDCTPCFKRQCPKPTHLCMDDITPEPVIEELDRILERK